MFNQIIFSNSNLMFVFNKILFPQFFKNVFSFFVIFHKIIFFSNQTSFFPKFFTHNTKFQALPPAFHSVRFVFCAAAGGRGGSPRIPNHPRLFFARPARFFLSLNCLLTRGCRRLAVRNWWMGRKKTELGAMTFERIEFHRLLFIERPPRSLIFSSFFFFLFSFFLSVLPLEYFRYFRQWALFFFFFFFSFLFFFFFFFRARL